MTNPEPAGAGTAEAREIMTVFFQHASLDHARNAERLAALVASAITAAESRAMERCAKIAEDFSLDLKWRTEHRVAAGRVAQTIRSSINPPGEEE